jgi:hypothetical protein
VYIAKEFSERKDRVAAIRYPYNLRCRRGACGEADDDKEEDFEANSLK